MTAPPAVAVLGLGEAGAAIAGDIALSGNRVIGYDPVQSPPDGIEGVAGIPEAVAEAKVVLSINAAAVRYGVVMP